jgi:excisionase family DNA binding protein
MTERRPRPRLQPAQRSTPTVFLTVSEAAALLRLSEITLGRWRIEGSGPPFRKFGRRVLYARADLDAWADAQRRHNTSQQI